jgi:SAM-dependent methyltransferase
MNWTDGYSSDVTYTAGFYREQAPALLDFICVLNGYEPTVTPDEFTWCELGCGQGLTANLLAASHPQGQFYAIDFNPAHIAGARQLATAAGLTNLTFIEDSFEAMAAGSQVLPQFDFITFHGIYTWVSPENRNYIVQFIANYLKPGGLVYVSYNAMPGWSAALPLQRLLIEHANQHPMSSDTQIKGATAFIERLEAAQASFFMANEGIKPRLEMLKTGNPRYLVHEYLQTYWQPLYHADVARDLAVAKMQFVGLADTSFLDIALQSFPDKHELLNSIADTTVRETVKDYFLNTSFRKDVYVRGARKINELRKTELLAQFGLALLVPRDAVNLVVKITGGEVTCKKEIYEPILNAIAKTPQSLAQLALLLDLEGQDVKALAQVVAVLTTSGQACCYRHQAEAVPNVAALAMNRVLAAQARLNDEYSAFSSPLLGNGVPMQWLERVVYDALMQGLSATDHEAIFNYAWRILKSQNRFLVSNGQTLTTDEANRTELDNIIKSILVDRLPLWRQWQII